MVNALLLLMKSKAELEVISSIQHRIQTGEIRAGEVFKTLQRDLNAKLDSLDDSEENIKNLPAYKEYKEQIWEVRNPNAPFADDNSDDDLQVTGLAISTECPITVWCNLTHRDSLCLIRILPIVAIHIRMQSLSTFGQIRDVRSRDVQMISELTI